MDTPLIKNVTFQLLGSVGDIVEKWHGAYTTTNLEFDWSVSEPVDTTCTLRYDYGITILLYELFKNALCVRRYR